MKAFLKALCTLLMLGSLAIPVQAATYLDVKLMEAVVQGKIAVVDSCLEKGANVNAQHGPQQETPLMRAIDTIAKDSSERDRLWLSFLGLLALSHRELLRAVYKNDVLSPNTRFRVNLLGGATIAYSLIALGMPLKNRLEIINVLLKDPAIKVTLTDADTKTALARTREHLANLSQKRFKDKYKIKNLAEIEKLLLAKESEQNNEEQHA